MGASSITVDGQRVVDPGGYSQVRASQAADAGLAAAGIPCLVGDCAGPEPLVVHEYNSLDELREYVKEGDLLDAAVIMYSPLDDERVLGRPSKCFVVPVNQNTQSTGTFYSASGAAMLLTSTGYGAYTERISLNVLAGTNQGKALTVALDDLSSSGDDIGGEDFFSLGYSGSAATMTATLNATGLSADQTFTNAGLDDEILTGYVATDPPRVASSDNTYDKGHQVVTVYGLDATNAPISESLTVNGTTAVLGSTAFSKVTAVTLSGMSVGTITVTDQQGSPNTVCTFSPLLSAAPTAGVISVYSGSSADVGQLVSVRGYSALGTPISETVTLNGTNEVDTTTEFTKVTAVVVTGTTVGTVTVEDSLDTSLLTLGAATNPQKGLYIENGIRYPSDLSFSGIITLVQDTGGVSTDDVVIRGTNSSGQVTSERVVLNQTTPVPTSTSWKTVTQIELGQAPNGEDTIFSNTAWSCPVASFDDFDVLEAYVNSNAGFTLTQLNTEGMTLSDGDYFADVDIKTATAGFTADLMKAINWVNNNTDLVVATRVSGGTGALLELSAPQYLSGGADVAPTAANYTTAFAALEETELDYFTPLSTDASVHALADAHAVKMASASGRSERMVYVGVPANTTKANVKAKAKALNSRHTNLLYEEIKRYDDTGAEAWYSPVFAAAMQMGAQASARTGVPLTHKTPNVLDVRCHSSISPTRDASELIDAGVSSISTHATRSFIWRRTMTTYTTRTINAFQESSANDSLNRSVKDLRTFLEDALTGEPSVDVSAASIRRLAEARLEAQVAAKMIAAYQNVTVYISGTRVEVSYEVAPVLPLNFVLLTTHVFEISDAA